MAEKWITVPLHAPEGTIELAVDMATRQRVVERSLGIDSMTYKGYSKPERGRWQLGTPPVSIEAEPEWYVGVFAIDVAQPLQDGDRLRDEDARLVGRVTAREAPGFFAQVCSAHGVPNPVAAA